MQDKQDRKRIINGLLNLSPKSCLIQLFIWLLKCTKFYLFNFHATALTCEYAEINIDRKKKNLIAYRQWPAHASDSFIK